MTTSTEVARLKSGATVLCYCRTDYDPNRMVVLACLDGEYLTCFVDRTTGQEYAVQYFGTLPVSLYDARRNYDRRAVAL